MLETAVVNDPSVFKATEVLLYIIAHVSVNYKSIYLGIPYFIDVILLRYHKIRSLKKRDKKQQFQYQVLPFAWQGKTFYVTLQGQGFMSLCS